MKIQALLNRVLIIGLMSLGIQASITETEVWAVTVTASPAPSPLSPPTNLSDPKNIKNTQAECDAEAALRGATESKEVTGPSFCNTEAGKGTYGQTLDHKKIYACLFDPKKNKYIVVLSAESKEEFVWAIGNSPRYGCMDKNYLKKSYAANYGFCYHYTTQVFMTYLESIENTTGFNLTYSFPTELQGEPKITQTLGTTNGVRYASPCVTNPAVYKTFEIKNVPIVYGNVFQQ